MLVFLFISVNRHYQRVEDKIAARYQDLALPKTVQHVVLVPVSELNRAALRALAYARTISVNIAGIHVTDDLEEAAKLKEKWMQFAPDIPFVVLESPYRALVRPLLAYIDAIDEQAPKAIVTVIVAELVPQHWWEYFLHNQNALRLRAALHFRRNTAVVSVPYHVGDDSQSDEDAR